MRSDIFINNSPAGHLASYLPPDYKGVGSGKGLECCWYKSHDQRASVSDYRYNTRHSEQRKALPSDPSVDPVEIGMSGMPVTVSAIVAARPTASPFLSKQPRFATLPKTQHNDVRLGMQRSDEDAGALGPGSYGPLVSVGGAQRSTYRLFNSPGSPGRRTHSPSRRSSPQELTPLYSTSSGMGGGRATSLSGTARTAKFGPFNHMSDSSHTSRPL